jgi:hypothetical protein
VQKTAERRVPVRTDVEPLPPEVAAWMPEAVAEASEQLEEALERREENAIAFEIAEGDFRAAQRAAHAAEDAAMAQGKRMPVADSAAGDALDAARRSMHAADRIAAAAVDHYIRTLDEHDEQIGSIIGGRMASENLRARQALADVEDAVAKVAQLDRLAGTLRNPRYTGNQQLPRRAWATPSTAATHAGLRAVDELFNICGGRQEAIAA